MARHAPGPLPPRGSTGLCGSAAMVQEGAFGSAREGDLSRTFGPVHPRRWLLRRVVDRVRLQHCTRRPDA